MENEVSFDYSKRYTLQELIEMINQNPQIIADIFCDRDHFFKYGNYVVELASAALNSGYKPSFSDVKKAPRLYNELFFIKDLIYKDPDNFKYIGNNISYPPHKQNYMELAFYAINHGYNPNVEDVKDNPNLSRCNIVMEILVDQNPSNFKYVGYSLSMITDFNELAHDAIKKGYRPTIEDLKKNKSLGKFIEICNCFNIEDIIKYVSNEEIIESLDKSVIDKITYQDYLDNKCLSLNRDVVLKFVKDHPNIILDCEYLLDNELIDIAIDNGFIVDPKTIQDSLNIDMLLKNYRIIKQLIDIDSEVVDELGELDLKTSSKVVSYAFKKGYRGELLYNILDLELDEFKTIEQENPGVIKYILNWDYKIKYIDEEVFKYLVDKNYKFSKEILTRCMNRLIPHNKNILSYYLKNNDVDILYLLENSNDRIKPSIVMSLINSGKDANNIINICDNIGYNPSEEEYEEAIKNGYIVTKENLNKTLMHSLTCMYMLCLKDRDYINYCKDASTKMKLNILFNNYIPTELEMIQYRIAKEPLVIEYLIGKNPKFIKYTADHELIKNVIEKYENIKIKELNDKYLILDIGEDMKIPLNSVTSMIEKQTLYTLIKRSDKEILRMINDSNNPSAELNDIYAFIFDTIFNNSDVTEINEKEIMFNTEFGSISFNILKVEQFLNSNKWLIIQNKFNKRIDDIYISLNINTIDRINLINNYDKYINFLKKCDIKEEAFIQHGLGKNNDWLNIVFSIIKNNKEDEFVKIYKYIKKLYLQENEIKILINSLLNYKDYKELFNSLLNNNIVLDEKTKNQLSLLLNTHDIFDEKEKPKDYRDLRNFDQIYKYKCAYIISSSKDKKEAICKILFNNDIEYLSNLLEMYGNTTEFKKLKFNTNNTKLKEIIDVVTFYVSFIDDIVNMDDDRINELANKIINDFDSIMNIKQAFNDYEEIMRKFYEKEANLSLTSINSDIDLSNKEYCLLVHVKSDSETVEEIIHGISSFEHNFISLSSISWRNQVFYKNNRLIFGYDRIPAGSFVQSSVMNMSSNYKIGSNDITKCYRKQRGILEISNSNYGNGEILCLRKGLKPCCIILPNRNATEEELKIAERFNLKLVKTQNIYNSIDEPEKMPTIDEKIDISGLEKLNELKKRLFETTNIGRKVALFTDTHALYEPLLAILEDIRKKGITEIYSLGDNIGLGPNPKEVMELLDEYNVKSIKGNHEIYVTEGIDKFKDHLNMKMVEAEINSSWTRNQLNENDINKIKLYPKTIELALGGKKIILCHYSKDYNTNENIINKETYDFIYQGHIHFEKENDNIKTLSGLSIGSSEKGEATYYILTEKEDGFDIEKIIVSYDVLNSKYSVIKSSLNESDKTKVKVWIKADQKSN